MEPQGRLELDFLKREGAESSENQFLILLGTKFMPEKRGYWPETWLLTFRTAKEGLENRFGN